MKTTISFLAVLAVVAILGFSIHTGSSVANTANITGCVVNGCAPAGANIYLYNSNNVLVDSAHADPHGFFRMTNIPPKGNYKAVRLIGTWQNGCTSEINNINCLTPSIDFCKGGSPQECF